MIELANWTGKPIEYGVERLPKSVSRKIHAITAKALQASLKVAVSSMNNKRRVEPQRWMHRGAAAVSGGVGGMFGMISLAVELPVSTTIMLRSIADIARAEGEDLTDIQTRLACLEVFALGGRSNKDDAAESSYFAIRAVLGKTTAHAAKYIAQRGLVEEGAPVLVRLLAKIGQRFTPVVAEKVAAGSVPVIGALGGAAINLLFVNHFQSMAQGHFVVRRLERKYGKEKVQSEYERLVTAASGGAK